MTYQLVIMYHTRYVRRGKKMSRSSKDKGVGGVVLIFMVVFGGLYYLYSSGLLGISGSNPFQSGISLEPLANIGNEIVNYISGILGISEVVVVIIIMALVVTKTISRK